MQEAPNGFSQLHMTHCKTDKLKKKQFGFRAEERGNIEGAGLTFQLNKILDVKNGFGAKMKSRVLPAKNSLRVQIKPRVRQLALVQ